MPKTIIQPDHKLEIPDPPFDPDNEPMVASGPSSGSKDGVPRRREPQIEEEAEVKSEPKVEVKLEEKKGTVTQRNTVTCTSENSW